MLGLSFGTILYDLGIVAFGVVVLLMLMKYSGIFKKLKQDTRIKFEETRNEATIARGTGNVGYEVIQRFNVQRMDDVRQRFNEESAKYISWVQSISLFPLLGLLGTVVGLVPGLGSLTEQNFDVLYRSKSLVPGLGSLTEQNFDVLYRSLGTALSSTIVGILCAIVLKVVSNFGASTVVNEIENILVENDREYTNLLNFHKLSEE